MIHEVSGLGKSLMYIHRKGNCNGCESSTHSSKRNRQVVSKILPKLRFILDSGSSPKVMAPSVAHCPSSHHVSLKSSQYSLKSTQQNKNMGGVIKITSASGWQHMLQTIHRRDTAQLGYTIGVTSGLYPPRLFLWSSISLT